MKSSWEWAEEIDRRVYSGHPPPASVSATILSIYASVIREAVNEARDEVIQSLRHVDGLSVGQVEAMKEAGE